MTVNNNVRLESSPDLERSQIKKDRFSVLPKERGLPDWACKALLIAGIVALVALTVFCTLWLSCPADIGLKELSLIGIRGVLKLGIFSLGAAALCGVNIYDLDQSRIDQAIRREIGVSRKNALKTVEKNADLRTVELFFEQYQPQKLKKKEKDKLLKLFNHGKEDWQKALCAFLNSFSTDAKVKNAANKFFESMPNYKLKLPKCLHSEFTIELFDSQDRLSQYLKALWIKKETPEKENEYLKVLSCALLHGFTPATKEAYHWSIKKYRHFEKSYRKAMKENDKQKANRFMTAATNHLKNSDTLLYYYTDDPVLMQKSAFRTTYDKKKKYEKHLQAAHQGYIPAVRSVISCLSNGEGVEKNEAKAKEIATAFHIELQN